MSEPVRHEYGTSLCTVQENQKLIIENCDPDTIASELRAANFTRDGSRYVKNRGRLRAGFSRDEDDTLQVLSARIIEDSLHVTPSDVVGIVRLVPGMSVQVEPKIEWDSVIDMLLTVYDIDRTQTHYGIPLEQLISSEIEANRILAILAINYVHGVRRIRQKGFIRDFDIRRRDGFHGIGSVDVAQSLLNRARGKLEPTWIETQIEYSNPMNGAIHMAGKLLLRLLQQGRTEERHPRHDVLSSMVHREVERMENLGIRSEQKQLGVYRRLSLADLPRQRHYYRRAFYTSQSILSSSLLGQAGGGPEELLVDYALSMATLFQDYSQRALDNIVSSLDRLDYLDQLTDVECKPEFPIYPFEGNTEARHQPDHLLMDGEDTIAVLDSKYYQEGKNPANESRSRSSMFAYAYLTESDRMAFLCPQYHPARLPVSRTGAEVEIVSPEGKFSCDKYEDALSEYVLESIAVRYLEIHVFEAVEKGHLSLSGVSEAELSEVNDPQGPFNISNPSTFADRVITAITFASHGPNKPELDNHGQWTQSRIRDAINRTDSEERPIYPQHQTTCVPVYTPNDDAEHGSVTLYFIRHLEEGTSVRTEGPWPLL